MEGEKSLRVEIKDCSVHDFFLGGGLALTFVSHNESINIGIVNMNRF